MQLLRRVNYARNLFFYLFAFFVFTAELAVAQGGCSSSYPTSPEDLSLISQQYSGDSWRLTLEWSISPTAPLSGGWHDIYISNYQFDGRSPPPGGWRNQVGRVYMDGSKLRYSYQIPQPYASGNYWFQVQMNNGYGACSNPSQAQLYAVVNTNMKVMGFSGPSESPDGDITLTWNPVPNVGGYHILYLGRPIASIAATNPTQFSFNAYSYQDPTQPIGDSAKYTIRPCSGGIQGPICGAESDVTVYLGLAVPENLTAPTETYVQGVPLSWDAVDGADYYLVEENGANGQQTSVSSHTYISTRAAGTYQYTVRACNQQECSEPSNVVNVVFKAPEIPNGLSGPAESYEQTFNLIWNGYPHVDFYRIREDGVLISSPSTAGETITSSLTKGVHNYTLEACSAIGCSGASSPVTIEFKPPEAPENLSGPSVSYDDSDLILNWSTSQYASSYDIYENGVEIDEISGSPYAVQPGTSCGSLIYQVAACSSIGCSDPVEPGVSVSVEHACVTNEVLFFESPIDGALVRNTSPAFRLRLNDFQEFGEAQLSIDVGGENPAPCTFDPAVGIGHCSLAQDLSDGWQTINATLASGEAILAQASISVAVDSDEDGVANHEDSCANTPLQGTVDGQGCALSQIDTDGDGITDGEEVVAGSDPDNATSFPAISIQAFSALPEQIAQAGDSTGLSWSVQGASSVILTNDVDESQLTNLAATGVAQVSPTITTTYTLTVEGPAGSASANVQVAVMSPLPTNQWGSSPLEQVPEAISASITVAGDGATYLGAFDGNYYRITPSGSLEWTLENVGVAMNSAAILGSQVFVGTNSADGGRILSVNADKSLRWDVRTESGVVASPVLNGDASIVYAACYDGTILGLSAADGSEQWRYELPEGETVSATPALSQDGATLFVHSNDHKVFALSTVPQVMLMGGGEDSSLIWKQDIGSSQ